MSERTDDNRAGTIAGWPNDAVSAFAPLLQARIRPRPQLDAADLNVLGESRGHKLQAQLLFNRGIAVNAMREFLRGNWHADPALAKLPVFQAAVARLRRAVDERARITVFGDYDCDGITSCAILVHALRAVGAVVDSKIPSRDDDGRGLNPEVVRELHERGTRLIVTTDCGTANIAEVEQARALGMDVLVTDHHPPHGENVASLEGMIVVNPLVEPYPAFDPNLCGAGVAFRVAEALLRSLPDFPAEQTLEELLDLAAVGTVSDVVPLSPSNWALAHAGLERLRTAARPGLRALMESAGLSSANVTDRDISFAIAPRLNAAPRLGQPEFALELLLADSLEQARSLAAQIEALNTRRQSDLDGMMAGAREQAVDQVAEGLSVLLVTGEDWSFGLIGLVAGRLAEEFHRPAFALSHRGGEYRASGRGPDGVDLGQALAQKAMLFRRFGGHARAAGFTVLDADYAELRQYLLEYPWSSGHDGAAAQANQPEFAPVLEPDCALPLGMVNNERYLAVHALEPYGPSFPEPVFLARNLAITRCWRSGPEGRTLRLKLRDEHGDERVVLWSRAGERFDSIQPLLPRLPRCDVAYTLSAFTRRDGQVDLLVRLVAVAPVSDPAV
ncbi:MAG TPA: single-stranded-DNA-specific exonuclease RecJ [Ktedonobacterales bacterium]